MNFLLKITVTEDNTAVPEMIMVLAETPINKRKIKRTMNPRNIEIIRVTSLRIFC